MKITVVGAGDAFGSGGRLHTCFHVAHGHGAFLIDCGATSLLGFQRFNLDFEHISHVFISHLHGDHFAGLIWWWLHGAYVSKRTAPLTVVGPTGVEARFYTTLEALYPGASQAPVRFSLSFAEFREEQSIDISGVKATPYVVSHPSGAPSYALRFEVEDRVIAFSGDTEWVDTLIPCSAGADLFICECSAYEAPVNYHLNWSKLTSRLEEISARRILLTHLGPDALANLSALVHERIEISDDGMVLEL